MIFFDRTINVGKSLFVAKNEIRLLTSKIEEDEPRVTQEKFFLGWYRRRIRKLAVSVSNWCDEGSLREAKVFLGKVCSQSVANFKFMGSKIRNLRGDRFVFCLPTTANSRKNGKVSAYDD